MTMARLHVATGSRWRRTVRIAGRSAFLLDNAGELLINTPSMTEAKKINAVANSNPATILLVSATPRRAAGLRGCRRGANLEDRNFC
jgi:hypothetical protein